MYLLVHIHSYWQKQMQPEREEGKEEEIDKKRGHFKENNEVNDCFSHISSFSSIAEEEYESNR